jgi:ribonuclease HII
MAWVIGIDEAGYGPNLGPFVMSCVACRVPDECAGDNLWHALSPAVRQAGDQDDGRVLVADSKVVYSTARGLLGLERGVHAALGPCLGGEARTLHACLEGVCPEAVAELRAEAWYRGTCAVPVDAEPGELAGLAVRFAGACAAAGVAEWRARTAVVCPPQFNALTDASGSKGAVLAHALTGLLRHARASLAGDDPLWVYVDKHGGRNTYAAFLQHALEDGFVMAREEGMARSAYQVHGLGRDVRVTFQPRAEAEHFGVALASMASKYLRELLMREFNAFWQEQVPGLKPTAGYPGDAARFYEAIRPAAHRLGIAEAALWRRR